MARVEVKLTGGHAQVEDRYTGYLADQHGRTWTAIMSKKSGDPADYPVPTRWTAPQSPQFLRGLFLPPPQYRKIQRLEATPVSLLIDYDGWISDLNSAQSHFDQNKVDVINHQAAGFDAIRQMENPSPALLKIIGPGPFPPLEIVEEMAEGDAWALGRTDVIPSWFTKELERQIVNTARETGLFQTWQLRELNKTERAERKRVLAIQDGTPLAASVEPREPVVEALVEITADTTWPQFAKAGRQAGKTRKEVSEDWKLHTQSVATVSGTVTSVRRSPVLTVEEPD